MASDGNGSNRWAIMLLSSILVCLIGLGLPGLYSMGRQTEAVEGMKGDLAQVRSEISRLTERVGDVIENDIADLRTRLTAWESAGALPGARASLDDLGRRMASAESAITSLESK